MKKKIILIFILFSLFCFSEQCIAQSIDNASESDFVKEMSKFLASQHDIAALKSKKDVYTFNLRITIKRIGKSVNVSNILFTDSIGYKVFPNHLLLKKLNYNKLGFKNGAATTLVLPILILNNPKSGQNPYDKTISLSNNSLTKIVSELLYPDILQKNITMFPLFTITRVDIQ